MKTLRHAKGIECNHPHVIEVILSKFVTCPHCKILLRDPDIKTKFEQQRISEIENEKSKLEDLDKKLIEEKQVIFSGNTFKCPKCNSFMVQRINSKTSEIFFGCKTYPICKATKNVKIIKR